MAIRGKGKAQAFQIERCEPRVPIEVGVRISGNAHMPGMEATFTENVSTRGARVRSIRRWRIGESIWVHSLTGGFCSMARVAYCENVGGDGYSVGVEFLELEGQWVMASPASLA